MLRAMDRVNILLAVLSVGILDRRTVVGVVRRDAWGFHREDVVEQWIE